MLYSHKRKFLFIQNPKTASTAVEGVLGKYSNKLNQKMIDAVKSPPSGWRPEPRPKHGGLYTATVVFGDSIIEDYYIFSVVRHPVDYLLSWFFFRKRDEIADPSHRAHKNYLGELSLDEYLTQIENRKRKRPDSLTRRLRLPSSESLVDSCVNLCRYESLESDLRMCCDHIGVKMGKLPRKNVSERRREFSSSEVTEDMRERIMKIYHDEAKELGYK